MEMVACIEGGLHALEQFYLRNISNDMKCTIRIYITLQWLCCAAEIMQGMVMEIWERIPDKIGMCCPEGFNKRWPPEFMMVKVIKGPLLSIFHQKQPLWLNSSGIPASNILKEIWKVYEKCVIFHLPTRLLKKHTCPLEDEYTQSL